jgi:ankyrin repeat protein
MMDRRLRMRMRMRDAQMRDMRRRHFLALPGEEEGEDDMFGFGDDLMMAVGPPPHPVMVHQPPVVAVPVEQNDDDDNNNNEVDDAPAAAAANDDNDRDIVFVPRLPRRPGARRHAAAALGLFGTGDDDDDDEETPRGRDAAEISSLLFDLIRQNHTCTSVLSGWGDADSSCENIVRTCNGNQDQAFFTLPLTGRNPIHEACLRNSCIHVIRALLHANALGATERDNGGNTPLHLLYVDFSYHSVNPQEIDEITQALLGVNDGAAAATMNTDRNLPLHMACSAPENMVLAETLERLIAANPNAASLMNVHAATPLSVYTKQRHATPTIARILLEAHPAAVSKLDIGGYTPLHNAAHNSNTALVQFLVEEAPTVADIRTVPDGRTALHLLCMQNPREDQIPAIQSLLNAAPDVLDMTDTRYHETPLHIICKHPRLSLEVVQLLTNRTAAATTDSGRYTPLHHACETGASVETVEFLLCVYEGAAKLVTRKQDTALHIACNANKDVAAVRLLIKSNPDALTMTNDYGFTPLHCVCRAYQPRMGIVQALLEANPSMVTMRTHGGESAVHLACSSGAFVGVLQLLTAAQSSVSDSTTKPCDLLISRKMTNKIGNTPLHEACFRTTSSFEHIETLAKSNPEWIVRYAMTFLILSRCFLCLVVVHSSYFLLLSFSLNNAGYTPLQILCKAGRLDERIVTTFARIRGPEVFSVVDSGGHTPLHSAAREGTSMEAIQALVRAYPDAMYLKTQYGDSPLHLACLRGASVEVAKFLAEASSDGRHSPLQEPNTAGLSPIAIAIEQYQMLCRFGGCCITSTRSELLRTYNVLAELVKIIFYGASYEDTHGQAASLVRASIAIHRKDVRLDPAFIRKVIHQHPEEVRTMDEEGNYPLHLEASIPIEKMTILDADVRGCCTGSCHKRAGVLEMLLEVFPDACRVRNNAGTFPLSLMMLNGRPWDRTLARALREFPPALHWYRDGLDEKLLSRTMSKVSRECGVDTLFNFIASKPEIIRKR